MQQTDLTNQFLISMPNLKDPNFEKTVTYICVHNEEGAMGIVINKPLEIGLGEIFVQMDISVNNSAANNKAVYHGGPVQMDHGFILHGTNTQWDSSIIVSPELCVTTSKDILEAIAEGDGPDDSLIALGYAGWSAGQLEQELMNNAWLTGPANSEIIFNTSPEECWQSAANHIGVDFDKLSTDIGHA